MPGKKPLQLLHTLQTIPEPLIFIGDYTLPHEIENMDH